MEVVILQVFVSLALVVSSLLLFAFSAKQRDAEHAARLSLLPLEEDAGGKPAVTRAAGKSRVGEEVAQGATGNG